MTIKKKIKSFFLRRKVNKCIKESKSQEKILNDKIESMRTDIKLIDSKINAVARFLKEWRENG